MLVFRTDAPRDCGIVELDEAGIVRGFHEKVAAPPGDLANGAVYLLDRDVIDFVARLAAPTVDFSTEVIPAFIGRIQAVRTQAYHRDIGSPEGLLRAAAEYPGARQPRLPARRMTLPSS